MFFYQMMTLNNTIVNTLMSGGNKNVTLKAAGLFKYV